MIGDDNYDDDDDKDDGDICDNNNNDDYNYDDDDCDYKESHYDDDKPIDIHNNYDHAWHTMIAVTLTMPMTRV